MNPKEFAVIVVDLQNDFCSPEGKMAKAGHDLVWLQETARKVKDFLEEVRKLGVPVIFFRYSRDPKTITEFEKSIRKETGIEGICKPGGWGSRLYVVRPMKGEEVLEKQGYSAFFGTGLAEKLRKKGVSRVIIVGTSTHMCVDSTVRDAFQHGFEVYVPENLVATREESRGFHDSSLKLIGKRFGYVLKSRELLKKLDSG